MADLTPFQTIGPYFEVAMPRPGRHRIGLGSPGRRIRIEGRVLDGGGAPVPDALIETWQSGPPGPDGFGRIPTDEAGGFSLETVMPAPIPGPGGTTQAPHLAITVFARGILTRLATRLYFADQPTNDADPILRLISPDRRSTLEAVPVGPDCYRFEIVLQGPRETVFFDV